MILRLKFYYMKKIYLIIAAAVMFFAVEANAQIGLGIGYNMVHNVQKSLDEDNDGTLNGLYIEGTYDFDFLEENWGDLGIEPGLRFTFAGDKESEEVLGVTGKVSENEVYLDLPILVKYSYDLDIIKLSAYAGPVLSCGLSSVTKVKIGENVTKTDYYGADSVYGRFDVKLGVGLGITAKDDVQAKIGYYAGLLNRYTGNLPNYSLRTGVFYIGVGYSF